MYKTIRNRFTTGPIRLVTAINIIGTFISLMILLWIFCFLSNYHIKINFENFTFYSLSVIIQAIQSHGFLSSILSFVYLCSFENKKIIHFYILFLIGSLWLLYTTQSIWSSLTLAFLLAPFQIQSVPSYTI